MMRIKHLFRRKKSREIAKVISKYMKIDTQSMEIQISKTGIKGHESKVPTLYANIPILDLHSK